MKKTINIFFLPLIFSGCSFSGFHNEKKEIDVSNLAHAYFSKEEMPSAVRGYTGTVVSDVQLTYDSCFTIFMQNNNSDFPTEFAGKWKLNGTRITLSDTTANNNQPIYLSVNEDGSLTGKYFEHNFEFHQCYK